jgi:hypothetical protein
MFELDSAIAVDLIVKGCPSNHPCSSISTRINCLKMQDWEVSLTGLRITPLLYLRVFITLIIPRLVVLTFYGRIVLVFTLIVEILCNLA